jgi:hypothetical protein
MSRPNHWDEPLPIFSSLTPGEFYSTPDVEDEAVIPAFQLDYAPVVPGTLRMELLVLGRAVELHDDGHGTVFAEDRGGFLRGLWQGLTRRARPAVKFGTINYEDGTVHLAVAAWATYQFDTGEEKGNPLADLSKEFPEEYRADFRKLVRGEEPSKEFMELLERDEDAQKVVESATNILCACFGFPQENSGATKEGS